MEERYGEVEKEGKLEEYYFGYNEVRSTHDTMENRFVKYTLQSIGRRLSSVITTYSAPHKKNSQNVIARCGKTIKIL